MTMNLANRHFARILLGLALVVLLLGCSDAPNEAQLTQVIEQRLASAFEPGTFSLASLRRLGSGPLADTPQGKAQRIVYYNAVLTFERDLDFSSWDTLNVAAFANLLGATEQGVSGLAQGGNHKGDRVYAHGTASFVRDGDGWSPVAFVQPRVGTPAAEYNTGPASQSQQMIERISSLLKRETADPEKQREIIREELSTAYSNISIQLDRLDRSLIVAGGPEDGEYIQIARLLAGNLAETGTPATAVATTGSVANLRQLREGRADVALVQNDVALLAQLGKDGFASTGPYYELRALASLFPEPLHVVVASDSPIREISDLAGKRVEIGQPNSGSRSNALQLLQAVGLSLEDLEAIHETGLEQGLRMLSEGKIDALIATVSAPARRLQEAAVQKKIRFLRLPETLQAALASASPDLVPIRLPASTYPNQASPIDTVAVTALLVAPAGLPQRDVDQVLGAMFDRIDFLGAGSAPGSLISRATARVGVTIPMHPAAIKFLDPPPVDTADAAPEGDPPRAP